MTSPEANRINGQLLEVDGGVSFATSLAYVVRALDQVDLTDHFDAEQKQVRRRNRFAEKAKSEGI